MTLTKAKDGGEQTTPEGKGSNRPLKSFGYRGVRASVWANPVTVEGRPAVLHKVTLTRTYKDGDAFKSTASLGREDLPIAAMLLDDAFRFILEVEAHANRQQSGGE